MLSATGVLLVLACVNVTSLLLRRLGGVAGGDSGRGAQAGSANEVDIERAVDIVAAGLSRQRLGMTLMLGFGIAAVALAAVGVYGVITYGAAQRRNEMAIRLALGATSGTVFRLTLAQGRTVFLMQLATAVAVSPRCCR